MKKISLLAVLVLGVVLVGCSSGTTSNDDITAAANQLKKDAEGKPQAPPVPGLQQMSGGGGQAPAMGPKGIKGK